MELIKPIRGIQINRTHPLSRGLVCCWLMNEGGGNKVSDLAGRLVDTWYGTPTWTPGRKGTSLVFSGSVSPNDYISWPLPSFLSTSTPFSIALKIKNLGDNINRGFLGIFGPTDNIVLVSYFTSTHNNLDCSKRVGSTFYTSMVSSVFTTTNWNQIVYTNPGTLVRTTIYINGILNDQSVTGSPASWSTNVIHLGRGYNFAGYSANCQVEYLYIWNRVLSAAEIARLYLDPFCFFQKATSPVFVRAA